MSYISLFGAFPIAPEGSCLDQTPNKLVGELRGSTRNGVFFGALGGLLNALPSHESLRFFANEPVSPQQRNADGILWTLLDSKSITPVIAALDSLLDACQEKAAVAANTEFFRDQGLTAEKIRDCLTVARECSDVNVETSAGEDGDCPQFLFNALKSLRGLLRKARTQSERIAIFTW